MGTDPGLTFLHVLTIPRLCCSLYLRYGVFANAFLYLSIYHHLSSCVVGLVLISMNAILSC